MMTVKDIKEVLLVSDTKAYQIIKQLNEELQKKGFMTVRGKVSSVYFNERFFGNTVYNEKIN